MHVVRGHREVPRADRAVTDALVEAVRSSGEAGLRVWTPPRQVAFGPRDVRTDGYDRARRAASERGYLPVEREAGGRAVAYTGSTVAFALATPVDDGTGTSPAEGRSAGHRRGIEARYDDAMDALTSALASLGVDPQVGEPADSFCPGSHSLQAEGKVAGLAQRVRRDVAVVGGIVVVADHEAVASVLGPVYDALGLPLDPDAVGSVARAGGDGRSESVAAAVESALLGDRPVRRSRATDLAFA